MPEPLAGPTIPIVYEPPTRLIRPINPFPGGGAVVSDERFRPLYQHPCMSCNHPIGDDGAFVTQRIKLCQPCALRVRNALEAQYGQGEAPPTEG